MEPYTNGVLSDAKADFVFGHAVTRIESHLGRLTNAIEANSKVTRMLTWLLTLMVSAMALAMLALVVSGTGVDIGVAPNKLEIKADK